MEYSTSRHVHSFNLWYILWTVATYCRYVFGGIFSKHGLVFYYVCYGLNKLHSLHKVVELEECSYFAVF